MRQESPTAGCSASASQPGFTVAHSRVAPANSPAISGVAREAAAHARTWPRVEAGRVFAGAERAEARSLFIGSEVEESQSLVTWAVPRHVDVCREREGSASSSWNDANARSSAGSPSSNASLMSRALSAGRPSSNAFSPARKRRSAWASRPSPSSAARSSEATATSRAPRAHACHDQRARWQARGLEEGQPPSGTGVLSQPRALVEQVGVRAERLGRLRQVRDEVTRAAAKAASAAQEQAGV